MRMSRRCCEARMVDRTDADLESHNESVIFSLLACEQKNQNILNQWDKCKWIE